MSSGAIRVRGLNDVLLTVDDRGPVISHIACVDIRLSAAICGRLVYGIFTWAHVGCATRPARYVSKYAIYVRAACIWNPWAKADAAEPAWYHWRALLSAIYFESDKRGRRRSMAAILGVRAVLHFADGSQRNMASVVVARHVHVIAAARILEIIFPMLSFFFESVAFQLWAGLAAAVYAVGFFRSKSSCHSRVLVRISKCFVTASCWWCALYRPRTASVRFMVQLSTIFPHNCGSDRPLFGSYAQKFRSRLGFRHEMSSALPKEARKLNRRIREQFGTLMS